MFELLPLIFPSLFFMHSQARGSLLAAEKGAMGETERRSEKAPRYGHSGNVAMCEGRRSMSVDLEKKRGE